MLSRQKRYGPKARAPYRRTKRSTSRTWSGFRITTIVGGCASRRSQTVASSAGGAIGSINATSPPAETHVDVTSGSQPASGVQSGCSSRHVQSPSATSRISLGMRLILQARAGPAAVRQNAAVKRHRGDELERLRRLQELTDAALAHLQLEELLDALLERVRGLLEVDTTAILLLDELRGDLVARAAVGLEEEVELGVRIPVGRGFAGRIAAERRPLVLADVDHADVLNPLLREKGIKSLLGVPVIAGGRILGVVHVGSLVPRSFGADDVELLQFAADRAAIAIDHARLFAAEREARNRLEALQAITDAALSELGLDDLLTVLLPKIRKILDADTCAVL